jgi:CBS domain-containing protein
MTIGTTRRRNITWPSVAHGDRDRNGIARGPAHAWPDGRPQGGRVRCDEVMVRQVQTCRPDSAASVVAGIMREYDIGFVPVVDEAQRVVGVVTDRDLAMRVLAQRRGDPPIEAVMSRHVVACRSGDDLGVAERLMTQHKKARIVCTDTEGRLEGVVSVTDLAAIEGDDALVRVFRAIANRDTWFLML